LTLDQIRVRIAASEPAQALFRAISENRPEIPFHGACGSLPAFLLAHLRKTSDRQILAVTPTTEAAEELRDDLESIVGEDTVRYFPDWELIAFEEKSPHVEVTALRLEALQSLLVGEPVVIVAPVVALLRPTLEPEALAAASRVIRVNDLLDMDELAKWLRSLSFEPANQVQEMGQYARRGGIIDIFTFGSENPYRVELFDDEVESIREFDPATQRSVREVDEIEILPRREILAGSEWWGNAAERASRAEEAHGVSLDYLKNKLEFGIHFEGIEFWCPVLTGTKPSVLDHLDSHALVFLSDPESIEEHAEKFARETARLVSRRIERGEPTLPPEAVFHSWQSLQERIPPRCLVSSHSLSPPEAVASLGAQSARRYDSSLEAVRADIDTFAERGFTIVLYAENESQARRLEDLLGSLMDRITVEIAKLHGGFVYPSAKLFVVNDHELFSRYQGRHRFRKFRGATPVVDVFALSPGDLVVHEEHGIGVYQGLERITVDGVSRDCLRILYRDQDRLFVPADQINRVQRYSQDESARPVLSKLGGSDWERVKERTRKGVLKLAQELIELYAIRQSRPGFAFSPDSTLMEEMEAAFIYEETRDQLRAISQIKGFMESPVPMDLLLCGDVGYGKTEVAIRAAFKAACDGKQVAVLVPTTILAQQHFRTFSERLAGFPVKVDVLSRFRSKRETEETLYQLKRGSIDIVIGTHRLLSDDVEFRDLGLLVIDEEHRFGVRHKERLKHMRQTVDVMSMTATPIPRTLYLSLMGARDMAVINTPPRDRLPVHTEVIPFDEDRISEAILREVARSGQVFFVHNRVQTIEERAEFLRELLPELQFRVAHGQMSEHQLEKVMLDFLEHRFDCLVTTMIIQSGLDMPNVNTILVDRSDQFGLAELYQLRGRVGRSNHKAFAYLMVPKDRKLPPESRRRLRAIEEFSDLGSGFKVAMRDLEIRGAGNLLGNEQSGFIAAIGFEMYVKLLDDAVKELKGEIPERTADCEVDVHVSAFLPDAYVSDGEQKMTLYRRLAESQTLVEVNGFADELRDRFGRLPEPARALIDLMKVKVAGRILGARRIAVDKHGKIRVILGGGRKVTPAQIGDLVRRCPEPVEFKSNGDLVMEIQSGEPGGPAQAARVAAILESLIDEDASDVRKPVRLVWEER